MASKVEIVNIEELREMHAGSLMSRRESLLQCEESFDASDRNGYEAKPSVSETGVIEFKDSIEWKQAYDELKKALASRENILNKEERKLVRQQKTKR